MSAISSAISSALLAAPAVPVCTLPDKPTACPLAVSAVRAEDGQGAYVGLLVVSGGTSWLVAVEGMTCAADAYIAVGGFCDGGNLGDGLVGWPDVVSAKTEGRTLGRAVNARLFDLMTNESVVPAELLRGACRRAYDLAMANNNGGADASSALDAARAATAAAERRAADAIAAADALRAEVAALRAAAPAPEVVHPAMADVLAIFDAHDGRHPWLFGPAGTGKSRICEDVAAARGWEYHYSGAIRELGEGLRGFRDISGNRCATEWVRALDSAAAGRDVLMVFDEVDASTPELMMTLNGFLAGGAMECCGKLYTANDKLHIIACGNTCGGGADSSYSARESLDAATLDRFTRVRVTYSRKVEELLAGDDMELADFCDGLRAAARTVGADLLVTYRSLRALKARGASPAVMLQELGYSTDCDTWASIAAAGCDALAPSPWRDALRVSVELYCSACEVM